MILDYLNMIFYSGVSWPYGQETPDNGNKRLTSFGWSFILYSNNRIFMSEKFFLPILILIPLIVLALILKTGLSQNSPATNFSIAPTQTSSSGSSVTVSVEYMSSLSSADLIVFQVSLNTHSIDLDGIDFQKSVSLEKSGQNFSPLSVETSGSGHHRSAEVKFSRIPPPFKIIFLETPEVAQQEFMFDKLK